MDMDDERRKAFEDLFSRLTPAERRGRIFLKPEFRDAYNELVEADRQFPVPTYLWEKWVPVLGVFPVAVYLELRRMCFVNRATGERRDWCWPKQDTIAKRLGVRKRQTVGEALRVLEDHGFIRRERSYRKRGGAALMQRGSDRYLVYFEVPLVPADAVELLLRQTTPTDLDGRAALSFQMPSSTEAAELGNLLGDESDLRTDRVPADMSAKRTNQPEAPDTSEERTYPAVQKTDSRTITRTMTNNVTNVVAMPYEEKPRLREHPKVLAMHSDEKARRSALVWEIGEYLSTMSGERGAGTHKSAGFHRRVAFLMPEMLVRQALMATRDALEQQRTGRGGLRSDPGAFFAGAVKELAKQEGIDLGLKPKGSKAAESKPVRSQPPSRTPEPEEPPADPAFVRELLAGLTAKLSASGANKTPHEAETDGHGRNG